MIGQADASVRLKNADWIAGNTTLPLIRSRCHGRCNDNFRFAARETAAY